MIYALPTYHSYSASFMQIKHRFRSPSRLLRSHDACAHGLSIWQDVKPETRISSQAFQFCHPHALRLYIMSIRYSSNSCDLFLNRFRIVVVNIAKFIFTFCHKTEGVALARSLGTNLALIAELIRAAILSVSDLIAAKFELAPSNNDGSSGPSGWGGA